MPDEPGVVPSRFFPWLLAVEPRVMTDAASRFSHVPVAGRLHGTNGSTRIAAIDWLRVFAMIAVVVMHAGENPFLADSRVERLVRSRAVAFNVATFFLLSGFLAADERVMTVRTLTKRLARVIPPYIIASVTVMALGFADVTTPSGLLYVLATGSALGIYYFIFNLVLSLVLIFVLTRVYPPMLPYVVAGCVAWWVLGPMISAGFQGWGNAWTLRDPTRYFPYVAGGWLVRRNFDALRWFWNEHHDKLAATALMVVVAYLAAPSVGATTPLGLPVRACYVAAIFVLGIRAFGGSPGNRKVRFLGDVSYTIYLYHMLFLLPALPYATSLDPLVRIFVLTVVGVAGGGIVGALGRTVFGRYSRWVIGA